MKIIITLIALLTIATSCTGQHIARKYGGKLKIELPKGEKLMMATWKEANLFYLTEPMDSGYIPKEKVFRESSNFGVWESEITFIEMR
jgi:hypothetical protein